MCAHFHVDNMLRLTWYKAPGLATEEGTWMNMHGLHLPESDTVSSEAVVT